jgi:hypothetical protein
MNRWLQRKRYRCGKCGAVYLHDHAHRHHCFECPARPIQRLVLNMYEPKAGR